MWESKENFRCDGCDDKLFCALKGWRRNLIVGECVGVKRISNGSLVEHFRIKDGQTLWTMQIDVIRL